MSARGHGAVITNERGHFNKFQRYTPSIDTHKRCDCNVRTFLKWRKMLAKL